MVENRVERRSDATGLGGGFVGVLIEGQLALWLNSQALSTEFFRLVFWPFICAGSDTDLSPNKIATVFPQFIDSPVQFFSQIAARSTWFWSCLAARCYPVLER